MQKIIVIEDSGLVRLRVTKALEEYGYNNIMGFSSADLIAEKPEAFLENVSLIITDIRLDGMSGIELTQILNRHPIYYRIPIIFLSGNDDRKTIKEAIQAGGIDYIVKPFNDQVLVERVKRVIGEPIKDNDQLLKKPEEIKEVIGMEYERAIRAGSAVSFVKLLFDDIEQEKIVLEIKNHLRKIDQILPAKSCMYIILPLTNEKGLEIVSKKIEDVIEKNGVTITKKVSAIVTPDQKEDLSRILQGLT